MTFGSGIMKNFRIKEPPPSLIFFSRTRNGGFRFIPEMEPKTQTPNPKNSYL
jgi:hypothetical protein